MIYQITYQLNNKSLTKVCTTLREAETFFEILLSAKANYIKVITMTKRGTTISSIIYSCIIYLF